MTLTSLPINYGQGGSPEFLLRKNTVDDGLIPAGASEFQALEGFVGTLDWHPEKAIGNHRRNGDWHNTILVITTFPSPWRQQTKKSSSAKGSILCLSPMEPTHEEFLVNLNNRVQPSQRTGER